MTHPRKGPPPIVYIAITLAAAGGLYFFLNPRNSSPFTPSQTSTSAGPSSQSPTTNPPANAPVTSTPSQSDAQAGSGAGITLSTGETQLFPNSRAPSKSLGIDQLAQEDITVAIRLLELAQQEDRNDPESLIYLNNARARQQGNTLNVAVVVPVSTNPDRAKETLRGVAQAQDEWINAGGIDGQGIQILIADDGDTASTAPTLAQALVNRDDILGVIGHNSSGATEAAAAVYQASGLPMISSTSTSTTISALGDAIYRTVPSDQLAGTQMARYVLQHLNLTAVAIFYNPQSSYSTSLRNAFATTLSSEGGEVVTEFDFGASDFNASTALQTAQSRAAQALFLAPNNETAVQARAVLQANATQSPALPVVGGDVLFSFATLQEGGAAAVGLTVAIPWHPGVTQYQPFAQQAATFWGGQVSWRTALAYDATSVLLTAIQEANRPERAQILATLNQTEFTVPNGASGDIRFLPSGDRDMANVLVTVQPGSTSGTGFDFRPLAN